MKKVVMEPSHKLKNLELDPGNKNHKKTVEKVIFAIKINGKIYKL